MKRKLRILTAACLAAVFVCLPVLGSADPVIPETWDGVMEIYGEAEITQIEQPVYSTQKYSWQDINSEGILGATTVAPYAADGSYIPEDLWPETKPATGQHALGINMNAWNYALVELVILGDVIGSGTLSIAQLTRLAQALNGSAPLEGVYAQAGDLSGDGQIGISDLSILARWLTGRVPRSGDGLAAQMTALF